MKNIFVLPSDKPSRLHFDGKELFTTINLQLGKTINSIAESRNIYITNSEEINKDTKPCWCINTIKNTWNDDLIYYQGAMPQYHYIGFKKIILTTNPELIKNGVQEVSNEFLEWFIKNPSCEFVEVERVKDPTDRAWYNTAACRRIYTPIIPTQEQKQDLHFAFDVPKQETIDEVAKDLNYWKNNAEEDYLQVPISVLRYISELEKAIEVEYAQHKKHNLLRASQNRNN